MNKYPLIGGSILVVVLLVLGSLTNVVGYQSVKSSVMSDSPLFSIRTKRAINEESKDILVSKYIGKGKNTILFPIQYNKNTLFSQIISVINSMEESTFKRCVSLVISRIHQDEGFKSVNAGELKTIFYKMRNNPKEILRNINEVEDKTPTSLICLFTISEVIFGVCLLGIVAVIWILFILFISGGQFPPTLSECYNTLSCS